MNLGDILREALEAKQKTLEMQRTAEQAGWRLGAMNLWSRERRPGDPDISDRDHAFGLTSSRTVSVRHLRFTDFYDQGITSIDRLPKQIREFHIHTGGPVEPINLLTIGRPMPEAFVLKKLKDRSDQTKETAPVKEEQKLAYNVSSETVTKTKISITRAELEKHLLAQLKISETSEMLFDADTNGFITGLTFYAETRKSA